MDDDVLDLLPAGSVGEVVVAVVPGAERLVGRRDPLAGDGAGHSSPSGRASRRSPSRSSQERCGWIARAGSVIRWPSSVTRDSPAPMVVNTSSAKAAAASALSAPA
ncbi:hypothetical protein [Micromonospora sp. NPDC005113]